MGIRDTWDMPWTMWDLVTLCGGHVMSKLHMCADYIVAPSGNVIVIELVSGHWLIGRAIRVMRIMLRQMVLLQENEGQMAMTSISI